jgi:hypothetical protein
VRFTVGAGEPTEHETYWDPEAEAMSAANYRRLLEILFAPRPLALGADKREEDEKRER